jgi:hypothetical protein
MKVQVNEFGGIIPKLANDKIPNNLSQIAHGAKVSSKELIAYKRSVGDVELSGASYKSLFEYIDGSTNHWVYYDSIVHWARSPVADDEFSRMYFTGVSGEYRAFSNDLDSDPWDFLVDFYEPGAPSGTAPTIVSGGGGSDYRVYFYTLVSRYGEEGPPSELSNEITDHVDGLVMEVNDIQTAVKDQNINAVDGNYPTVRVYRTEDDGAGNGLFLFVLEAKWFDTDTAYAQGEYVFFDDDLWECTAGGGHDAGIWNGGADFTKGESIAAADLEGGVCESVFYDEAPAGLTNLRSHPNGFFVASKGNVLHFTEPFVPWGWPEDYQIPLDSQIVGVGIHGSTIVVATDANIYTFAGPHPTSLYKTRLSFQPCLSQRGLVETDEGVMFPSTEGFQLVSAKGVANVTAELFDPEDWKDYELDTMHGTYFNKSYYGFYHSTDHEGGIRIDFINGAITTFQKYHQTGYVALQDGVFRTIVDSEINQPGVLFIARWDADDSSYRNFNYKSPRYILEKPVNMKVAQIIIDSDFYNDLLGTIESGDDLEDLNADEWAKLAAGNNWGAGDLEGPFNSMTFLGGTDHNDLELNGMHEINGDTLYSISALGAQDYVEFRLYADSVLKFTKQVQTSIMFKLPRGYKNKKWEFELDGMIPVKRATIATSTEEIV